MESLRPLIWEHVQRRDPDSQAAWWRAPFAHYREEDGQREKRKSHVAVNHYAILYRTLESHRHEHGLPRMAWRASQTMSGVIASAAAGSAQPIPKNALVASPTSAISER